MSTERVVLCGSVGNGSLPAADPKPLVLRTLGTHRNVRLHIDDFSPAVYREVPKRFRDLIDIAVYVYCADQAVWRGPSTFSDFGARWRRKFFFRVAVRDLDFWRSRGATEALTATLGFLSEDVYHFEFEALRKDEPFQGCFEFAASSPAERIEAVVLFSGGVDSTGGAVQEAVLHKRHVALVHHRSSEKMVTRHRQLLKGLKRRAGDVAPAHFPVHINKSKALNKEYTQRTRSFLYVSLGATIAAMLKLDGVRFYENGIVSLNLPPSAQVVGARATRTTHPQVLNGFARLLTAVAGKPFAVENPFQWLTKTQVVQRIAEAGCADLLGHTISCTHTWTMTNEHPHCGACSQCIDRRFAVLAAGQQVSDPADGYKLDLLTGEWPDGPQRTMLAAYLEMANQIDRMSQVEFFGRFGEASRVLRHMGDNPEATAVRVFGLYQRHAREVTRVVDEAMTRHVAAARRRELSPAGLLRMVFDAGGPAAGGERDQGGTAGTVPSGELPESYIQRRGKCWAIRFDGQEEKLYTPDVGIDYLRFLLEHPGTSYSASELDCQVRRQIKELAMRTARLADFDAAQAPVSDGFGADEILDAEYEETLRMRLVEVEEYLARARESDSPHRLDEIETLENDQAWIAATLAKSRGRSGRKRLSKDARNRVRNRVGNAIRRALETIKKYDLRLAEHLTKPILNLGHTLNYVPRDAMSWTKAAEATDTEKARLHEM